MQILILATRNRDKIKEIKELLADISAKILAYDELETELPDVEEIGTTLDENSLLKAQTISEITDQITIADDTGLEVEALNGAPGVYSARYAGPNASYEDNRKALLAAMQDQENRKACFRTVVTLYLPNGHYEQISGEVFGNITQEERGDNEFGYDKIFAETESGKTLAEMTLAEKNAISHRGRAFAKLKQRLATMKTE